MLTLDTGTPQSTQTTRGMYMYILRDPSTTQHNTTQHSTAQHNTTQHNTTQHNTTSNYFYTDKENKQD